MKCIKCNTENDTENRYCTKCGSELHPNEEIKTKFCPSCGSENEITARFCSNCGLDLSVKKDAPSRKQKSNQKPKHSAKGRPKVLNPAGIIKEHKVITGALFILLVFLIYQSVPKTNEYKNTAYTPSGVNGSIVNVMSDSITAAVVKNFDCSCGECTDPLDVCSCETAAEERSFIQSEAAKNISPEGIITSVKNKYGGFKGTTELNLGG